MVLSIKHLMIVIWYWLWECRCHVWLDSSLMWLCGILAVDLLVLQPLSDLSRRWSGLFCDSFMPYHRSLQTTTLWVNFHCCYKYNLIYKDCVTNKLQYGSRFSNFFVNYSRMHVGDFALSFIHKYFHFPTWVLHWLQCSLACSITGLNLALHIFI